MMELFSQNCWCLNATIFAKTFPHRCLIGYQLASGSMINIFWSSKVKQSIVSIRKETFQRYVDTFPEFCKRPNEIINDIMTN